MNMKVIKIFCLLIFGFLMLTWFQVNLLAQHQVTAKLPGVINFSGVITDGANNIVKDGEYTILFTLYTAQEGGNPVWSEFHDKVKVENGEINVQLGGATIPNPISITFDKLYFLGIKLNGEEELSPRIELLPSPYSIRTSVANNVRNNSISSSKIAPLAVTDSKIKSISWNKIKDIPKVGLKENKSIQSATDKTDLPKYWRRYGNYLETGNEFLGTMNDRNLVIKTDSIQRMLFDPYGKVVMGTVTDSVFFEVIGKTTLGNTYVKNRMGVGADFPLTKAKVHIKTTGAQTPFRVDNNGVEAFNISSEGRVEITSQLTGGEDEEKSYPIFINAEDQGVAIKIKGDESNSDHNYMTFWDDDGIAGRIEGMNAGDYASSPKVIAHDAWFVLQGVALGVAIAASTAGLELPDIINGTAEVAYFAFQTTWDFTHLGVAYESASGDYAEWLEKINHNEVFSPGEIVGVFGGKISKNTKNAEQIMSISLSPIVLGNMPVKGKENNYEKIAFKGQVPLKVRGVVRKGDYIIPSGLNDGIGIPVDPDMMTAEEFSKVVGKAWEENLADDIKHVNVAVGLKMKDIGRIVNESYSTNKELEDLVIAKNKELDEMLVQIKEIDSGVKLAKTRMKLLESAQERERKYSFNKK